MNKVKWMEAKKFEDILYHKQAAVAKITINRPQVRNAFRPKTVVEMMQALDDARNDEKIGVVILTGQGDKAFCSGGDQKIRGEAGYVDDQGVHRLNVLDFQRQVPAITSQRTVYLSDGSGCQGFEIEAREQVLPAFPGIVIGTPLQNAAIVFP